MVSTPGQRTVRFSFFPPDLYNDIGLQYWTLNATVTQSAESWHNTNKELQA